MPNLTDGSLNTAIGEALSSNTEGDDNVATGSAALLSSTTGGNNVATGTDSLSSNTEGSFNVVTGTAALLRRHDRQHQRRHRLGRDAKHDDRQQQRRQRPKRPRGALDRRTATSPPGSTRYSTRPGRSASPSAATPARTWPPAPTTWTSPTRVRAGEAGTIRVGADRHAFTATDGGLRIGGTAGMPQESDPAGRAAVEGRQRPARRLRGPARKQGGAVKRRVRAQAETPADGGSRRLRKPVTGGSTSR